MVEIGKRKEGEGWSHGATAPLYLQGLLVSPLLRKPDQPPSLLCWVDYPGRWYPGLLC